MLGRTLEKFAVQLCFVAALLMGISPGQGLVLCVGSEGSCSLELAFGDARCGGCPEISEQARTQDGRATLEDPADCPCSDYPVVTGNAEARSKLTTLNLDGSSFARVPVSFVASIAPQHARVASAAARAGPGVDPRLTALRTVVLRV
jgi:hypothetical protein